MTTRLKVLREILALAVMILVSFLMSPTVKIYEECSYSSFIKMIKEEDITSIEYCAEEKYAIIHQESLNEDFKVSIVSLENFEKDVYEYSLVKSDFEYSIAAPVRTLSAFTRVVILLSANILFRIWFKSFLIARVLKKMKATNTKDLSKEQYEELSKKFSIFKLADYHPHKVKEVEVKFSDVIGLEKQIDEIRDIVRFLKEPEKYEGIGAQLPKGVLLYGKPGVGKTYIARAIAGEAEVPFYETSASEFQASYLGESEERIRKFFKEAEDNAPSIIYIDEIDSIATRRYSEHSNKYAASIVNQLLACMDGFNKDSRVIVIAATNHIDTLDEALLRSGRFDRKIYIHEPDREARQKLIEYYSADKAMAEEVDIERFIDVTAGLTGSDIKTILNEAAILAVRKGKETIDEETIMEAFRKVEIGSENNYTPPSREKLLRTAIHEAGHAVISHHFGQNVSEISIISRGDAAGYNLSAPDEEANYSFEELKHRVMCFLGGRAAEEIVYDEISAGASDDLQRASSIIKDMFLRFSMSEDKDIGLVMTNDSSFNEVVVKDSYDRMNAFMKKCYEETKEILRKKIKVLKHLADTLIAKETLSKNEITKIFAAND